MSQPLTIGSLFAGIGGFDLAGEAMGWRTSWFVEWDASCRHWLAEHFPGRPIYGDITLVNFMELEPVDILCGGFPCPPVSAAGKRLGKLDPRWLWPHVVRAIRDLRPRYVAIENVPGLLSTRDDEFGQPLMGTVLGDVAALGYDAEWEVLSAGDVGSPQERERVWIVADRDGGRFVGDTQLDRNQTQDPADGNPRRGYADRCRGQVGDGDGGRREQHHAGFRIGGESRAGHVPMERTASGRRGAREVLDARWAGRGGEGLGDPAGFGAGRSVESGEIRDDARRTEPERRSREMGDWDDSVSVRGHDGTVRRIPREAYDAGPESPLWPVAPGLPGRVARLKAIGNTVVPRCVVEGPFRVIAERERSREVAP